MLAPQLGTSTVSAPEITLLPLLVHKRLYRLFCSLAQDLTPADSAADLSDVKPILLLYYITLFSAPNFFSYLCGLSSVHFIT